MPRYQYNLIWLCLVIVAIVPVIAAGFSPLLAWRQPIYILAGFAGIVALVLLMFQPLMAYGHVPGLKRAQGTRVHRWLGTGILLLIVVHVAGLWITSPPDVIDALLFRSPTPFSLWGVIAMWALFFSGILAAVRRKIRWRARTWRVMHKTFGVVVVVGSIVHALLIDGTMESVSKIILCIVVAGTLVFSY